MLKAKLALPPAQPMSLSRLRLLDLISGSLKQPLTLLCAPAGFGKTTLLSAWINESVDRPAVAWLGLDEDDSDPVRFFDYLRGALQGANVGVGCSATAPLSGAGSPTPKDRMASLLDDLTELDHPVVLVLDDYQAIDNPELDAALTFLVEHLPEHLRLIVATRKDPQWPLSRWRTRQWIAEVGVDQLRFTPDEAMAFLVRSMGLTLDAESARTLAARTEGWVAGLQIAALSLQRHVQLQGTANLAQVAAAFSGEHRHVIDYLAAEVMRQQPRELQDFLRKTCILDRFSADLCDAVTERTDSRQMLAQVERANLFLRRLDDQGRWFRYHQLLADFLREGLADPERIELHRRASAWFESHGMGKDAIKHALAARSDADAVRLFRGLVEDMLARGELPTLLAWLEMLPASLVRQHQDLAGYQAWLLFMSGRTAEAEEYYALTGTPNVAESSQEHKGILFALQAFLAITSDNPARAIELSRQALDQLRSSTSFFRVWALFYQGLGLLRTGLPKPATEMLRQALELGWAFGHRMTALDALAHLAPLMSAQGQLREAQLLCRTSLERCSPSDEAQAPISGLILIPMGMLAYERNELQEAVELLEAGVALCGQLGNLYHTLAGECALAKVHHARGAREQAWNALAAAQDLADRSRNPRRQRMVRMAVADLQLREGNVAAAKQTFEEIRAAVESSVEGQLLHARLLLASSHALAALRMLGTVEASCRSQGQAGLLVTVHVLQALGHRANGGRGATLEHLETAVSLAASGGYVRPFLDGDAALAGLLRQVSGAAPAFLGGLLEQFRQPADEDVVEANTAGLTRTQLEVLRLVSQGLANQQIATQLVITLGTAKWHVSQIFEKLGVRNRAQAIAKARQSNLL
ncbi:LuxR C-terminal-related transcriptional regulator [Variovorax paradoxus]|uniref:LuxR C-terminal-related transcriptional regulator n=1 Tax=Variovorax paradoxus TaxID=34073 RepID=UPI003F50ECA8